MAKTTEALDGDKFAEGDVLLADGVEDRDAGAKNGCVFDGIDVGRDTNDGLCTQEHILCIPSIERDAVYCLILAHLELPALARLARVVVT
jgi:hypothetical protein